MNVRTLVGESPIILRGGKHRRLRFLRIRRIYRKLQVLKNHRLRMILRIMAGGPRILSHLRIIRHLRVPIILGHRIIPRIQVIVRDGVGFLAFLGFLGV